VCNNCGLVVESRIIDEASEWRNFSSESGGSGSDPNRVGGPLNPLLGDYGLSTVIGGAPVNGALARWSQRNNLSSNDKTLVRAYAQIRDMAVLMNLPTKVQDKACEIFKFVDEKKSLKGKGMTEVIAAIIYIASKNAGLPRNPKEISQHANIKKKHLGRCYKAIKQVLPDQLNTSSKPSDWVESFCNRLNLPHSIIRAVKALTDKSSEMEIMTGKNPRTVAGAAIYMISLMTENPKGVREIAEVAKLSEGTIKSAYRKLHPYMNQIVPSWFVPANGTANLSLQSVA